MAFSKTKNLRVSNSNGNEAKCGRAGTKKRTKMGWTLGHGIPKVSPHFLKALQCAQIWLGKKAAPMASATPPAPSTFAASPTPAPCALTHRFLAGKWRARKGQRGWCCWKGQSVAVFCHFSRTYGWRIGCNGLTAFIQFGDK